jgi:hypothetical protein
MFKFKIKIIISIVSVTFTKLKETEENNWLSIYECLKSILHLAPALQGIQGDLQLVPIDLQLLEEISRPLEDVKKMLDKISDTKEVTIQMAVALIFSLQVNFL